MSPGPDNHDSTGNTPVDANDSPRRTRPDAGWKMPDIRIPKRGTIGSNTPGLQWKGEYSKEKCLKPRILQIDYLREDLHDGEAGVGHGTRRVVSQEIHNMWQLKNLYCDTKTDDSRLRVLHVQNWPEACKFLCHVFGLHDDSDLTGIPGFKKWIMQEAPQRRAGKPLLTGKTWKVSTDPWRKVTKCAAGMDYMKLCSCEEDAELPDKETKVLGLMGYGRNDTPVHRYEVYSQRVSVYVQQSMPDLQAPGPEITSPYKEANKRYPGTTPVERLYDNGNTIIIFDNSDSHDIHETLIKARGEWESRWRRLPFYLQQALHDLSPGSSIRGDEIEDDTRMTSDCMKVITQDIFKALSDSWSELLDASWEHVSILEDKIYEQPADESRAPELWRNSAHWVKFEKLMFYHLDCVSSFRTNLVELDGDMQDEGQWLRDSPDDFEKLSKLIDEDLKNRTADLSDLMYKSVGIRDSRQSLELGASMWRLSWVTFIFLPLTFISGFFGMNVDTFEGNPSMKWYFIAVFPFMFLVLIGWYLLKHLFGPASINQPAGQRGEYEALYTELQRNRPDLFSRQGPREYVRPASRIARIKWWLVSRWTNRVRNIEAESASDLGVWEKFKRALVRRWTNEIRLLPPLDPELGDEGALVTALQEGLGVEAGVGVSESVLQQVRRSSEEQDLRTVRAQRPADGDVGDQGGVLVEERRGGSLRQGDEDDEKGLESTDDEDEKGFLKIPKEGKRGK